MNEFAGPMFWIFGEIAEYILFLSLRTVEGWRGSAVLFFGTVKGWRGSGNFGRDEFAKYRDFPYIFPDLF